MAPLMACPFCRQLFPAGEVKHCPECGVSLERMSKLPPSLDQLAEDAATGESVPPEHRVLPWSYFGRGRGALLVLAVLGLVAFFLPWVEVRAPESISVSGFDLARGRAGWLWGGAVGWFMMIPLVWTRRTIARMRGVRIITALFAALTLVEVATMLALPPQSAHLRRVEIVWQYGIFLSFVTSVIGVGVAARFGGSLADLPALPWLDDRGRRRVDHHDGETLH